MLKFKAITPVSYTHIAKVFKNHEEIFLTSMEYKILLILATNPTVVFTREKILADIWDVNEDYVNDNTLTVYIKRLREKIEDCLLYTSRCV